MLIQGILSGAVQRLSPLSLWSQQPGNSAGPKKATEDKGTLPSAGLPAKATALRSIAAHYDVTRITPREFSELVDRLRRAGALAESDVQELAGIRADLEQAGIGSDEEIDLVDFYRRRLTQLQGEASRTPSPTSPAEIERTRRRLDWLARLAVMHREPEASALV